MSAIFLSASVPVPDRGSYHETADPFLIQCAVRELIIAVIRNHEIVWGGHPAITPMVWNICKDLEVDCSEKVTLYQSRFFEDYYPEDNKNFASVVFTDAMSNNRERNLLFMREVMLSHKDLIAAVFIGGMDGVVEEYELFKKIHPDSKALLVPSPGGAALYLAEIEGDFSETELTDVDFAKFFHNHLIPYLKNDVDNSPDTFTLNP